MKNSAVAILKIEEPSRTNLIAISKQNFPEENSGRSYAITTLIDEVNISDVTFNFVKDSVSSEYRGKIQAGKCGAIGMNFVKN